MKTESRKEKFRAELARSGSFTASVIALITVVALILHTPQKKGIAPTIFGATYMTMDNDYFIALNTSIKEVVESRGDILVTRDPAQNQKKQNEEIIDMLDMGAQFIFINPVDWKTITPALEECRRRGVPFIVVDSEIYNDRYASSVVVSDNTLAGEQIAEDLMRKKKSAKIVILYDDQINSMRNRVDGFLARLNERGFDYEIVFAAKSTSLPLKSMAKMQDFLELGIGFDTVLGANDPTVVGALAAMRKFHRSSGVTVYGIDGSPSAKQLIKQGSMEASSAQFPQLVGRKTVELAYSCLDGKQIPERVVVPVELITKENIDRFPVLGWQ